MSRLVEFPLEGGGTVVVDVDESPGAAVTRGLRAPDVVSQAEESFDWCRMETQSVLDQTQGRKTLRFLQHLSEMIVVMMLGMCVLGAVFSELHVLIFGSGFDTAWHRHLGLTGIVMAFNMTVPMVLWMRYRGHSWERGGEMSAAMNLALPLLLALYWLGVMGTSVVLPLQMMLMIPALLLLMLYRKEEYSAAHHRARHLHRGRWFAEAR